MVKAVTEAAEWLHQEPATDWGEHEWRLFSVVEEAEALLARIEELEAENARLREAATEAVQLLWEGMSKQENVGVHGGYIYMILRAALSEQEKDDATD